MYIASIGGNLVRLSKDSGMQKTRLISLDCHLPYLIHVLLSKKLIRVSLKLIIVDIKYIR